VLVWIDAPAATLAPRRAILRKAHENLRQVGSGSTNQQRRRFRTPCWACINPRRRRATCEWIALNIKPETRTADIRYRGTAHFIVWPELAGPTQSLQSPFTAPRPRIFCEQAPSLTGLRVPLQYPPRVTC
jgi:hypothetical protein